MTAPANGSIERLLRDTLHAPQLQVAPGVGLLERVRYDGERMRRRRRRRSIVASVAATLAIVGTGAALSPRLLPHPLLRQVGSGSASLRVDAAAPAPDGAPPAASSGADHRAALWTEQVGGHEVAMVATYDGHRVCVQPASAADAGLRPATCAGPATRGSGLLAGPVGGAAGIRQTDAALARVVVVARRDVAQVVARLPHGATYLAYLEGSAGHGQAWLFEVVMPAGQRVLSLQALTKTGRVVARWVDPRG